MCSYNYYLCPLEDSNSKRLKREMSESMSMSLRTAIPVSSLLRIEMGWVFCCDSVERKISEEESLLNVQ
jgi:hypothetical protein